MNNKQAISTALSALTAAAMTRCATTDLPALLELHNTAANAVSALPYAGPLTGGGSSCAEFVACTLVADDTPVLILAELRKHTALLEVLGKQGDTAWVSAAAHCDAAPIRIAPATPADSSPFDPVFECEEKDGKLIATISLRPGACAYLVNAVGPRSPAIKFSVDGPKHVQVAPLVEILP